MTDVLQDAVRAAQSLGDEALIEQAKEALRAATAKLVGGQEAPSAGDSPDAVPSTSRIPVTKITRSVRAPITFDDQEPTP